MLGVETEVNLKIKKNAGFKYQSKHDVIGLDYLQNFITNVMAR